jgi:hypothetical protein
MNHYNEMLLIAKSNGLTAKDVDNAMLKVAGKYSNMTDNEIQSIIQPQMDAICEPIYESEGAEAFNECRKRLIEDYRKKELRRSRSQSFWAGVGSFLKGVSSTTTDGDTTDDLKSTKGDDYSKDNDEGKRILGMKPLTFTLVTLVTLTALTIGIVYLTKKAK